MVLAAGIVPYANGLLIAHETNGGVHYLDLSDNDAVSEIIPNGTLPAADGLCIEGDTLYVAQNNMGLTGWFLATDGDVSAFKLGAILSEDFDSPATCHIVGENVYVTNARFSIGLPAEGEDDLSTFNETFQVVGVGRFDFSASGGNPSPSPSPTPTPSPTGNTTAPTSGATSIRNPMAALSLVSFMSLIVVVMS